MKKTNNVKANKVNMNKVNNNAKANNQFITKQLSVGISAKIETKTLSDIESWAYHTERDLFDCYVGAVQAFEDGKTTNLIPYTEAELNDMIIHAGLAINVINPETPTNYWTGLNEYEACMSIIKKCIGFIDVLHGKYDYIMTVKPKYTDVSQLHKLSTEIVDHYNKLYAFKHSHNCIIPFTEYELTTFRDNAECVLNVLNGYDCTDIINVDTIETYCNDVINMTNELFRVFAHDAKYFEDDCFSVPDDEPKYKYSEIRSNALDEYDDF